MLQKREPGPGRQPDCRHALISKTMNTPPSNQKAFTLVEIMIVVAIIALLAAIAVPGFMRARKRSQASRILTDLRLIDSAIDQYRSRTTKRATTRLRWRIGPPMSRKVHPSTTPATMSSARRMVHRRSINFRKFLPVITTSCLTWLGQASGHLTDLKENHNFVPRSWLPRKTTSESRL